MSEKRPHARRTLAPQPSPPAGIYASKYDPVLGAAICTRLAAGESLRAICRADPDMPTAKTVWNWARAHREFAMMKAHALGVARARALAAQAERDAAKRAARDAPGRRRRAWNAGLSEYDLGLGELVLGRLAEGESLQAICRDPEAPSVGTVYYWLRAYPEFLAEYRTARAVAAVALVETAAETAPWLGGEAASQRALRNAVRAAERRGARMSTKRYAPREGPERLRVFLVAPGQADADGRVIYDGT